jgi:hypothetical protein
MRYLLVQLIQKRQRISAAQSEKRRALAETPQTGIQSIIQSIIRSIGAPLQNPERTLVPV